MGKPPAVIIIVRHGARLDAADAQWHLTSPTPYDPPLTYGGWKQAQALGARIGCIIKVREDALGASQEPVPRHQHSAKGRRRSHKVVIHSSPFLRCVQTSISLSAGMNHWIGKIEAEAERGLPRHHTLHSGSPHIHALDPKISPRLSAIPEPGEYTVRRAKGRSEGKAEKDRKNRALLRLDPFLGEWMSPDYFENITPPPGSKLMVAGAKADLLRRGDPIGAVQPRKDGRSSKGNFPGGWTNEHGTPGQQQKSSEAAAQEPEQAPKLARAKTHSFVGSGRRGYGHLSSWIDSDNMADGAGYLPPTPSHAISPMQPIPQGYVAHARDACVKVDYQWDSMRAPLDWGSGGEYGEEWSSMHRRFRKGLHDIVAWYRDHEVFQEPDGGTDDGLEELHHARTSEPLTEEPEDTVLILVTHGAGCNALIGALTNQPVLIDVGLASLTMAVRKDFASNGSLQPSYSPVPTLRRRSTLDPGTSEEYDVKLMASTDHLRPGSHFLGGPQPQSSPRARSPSLPIREKSPYRYERHVGSHPQQRFNDRPVKETQDTSQLHNSGGSFEEERSFDAPTRASTTAESTGGLWRPPTSVKSNPNTQNGKVAPPKVDITSGDRGRPSLGNLDASPATHGAVTSEGNSGPVPAQPGLWKRRWTLGQA